MQPFRYERADSVSAAVRLGAATDRGPVDAATQFLAGGTTLIDLLKLDVLRPTHVVDIGSLPKTSYVEVQPDRLSLSAFASMAAVADHREVRTRVPLLAESLDLAASAQLRNMATLGGNVLQKTRCPYFRDPTWSACNKRSPGSGCTALDGPNRNHAVLGVDASCIAQYPGDFGVALMALDAHVRIMGRRGARVMPFASLHRAPGNQPYLETNLEPGDVIEGFDIFTAPWMSRSRYVKVRDRASYEFAIASAAVALHLQGDTVQDVRIGLGGMAYRPWRASEAEERLRGRTLTEASAGDAAEAALHGAITHGHNAYKPWLARATIVRALLEVKAMAPLPGDKNA